MACARGRLFRLLSARTQLQHERHLALSSGAAAKKKHTFKLLPNNVETEGEQYKNNMARYQEFEAMYKQLKGMALSGGGEKGITRHTEVYYMICISTLVMGKNTWGNTRYFDDGLI